MFAGFPFGMTTPKTVIPFGMTKSDFNCKPSFASALVRIFDFVLDTPARQCSFSCTFSRLGNSNKFDCARLIENVQINLTLPSLIRIFDCVLDTPSRHNQACACFCARLFVSLSSPKILPLGNVQINLTLRSLIRIFVKYFVPTGLCAAEALKTTENERTDSALR